MPGAGGHAGRGRPGAAAAAAAAATALALALGACAPAPRRTATPVGAARPAAQLPLGRWRVVGHYAVGASRMSMREADTWLRREAHYSATGAGFPPDTCRAPSYLTRTVSISELALDYHVKPEDLLLTARRVQVIEVRCQGPWDHPGGQLIVVGPDRLDTYWEGVMLELARE